MDAVPDVGRRLADARDRDKVPLVMPLVGCKCGCVCVSWWKSIHHVKALAGSVPSSGSVAVPAKLSVVPARVDRARGRRQRSSAIGAAVAGDGQRGRVAGHGAHGVADDQRNWRRCRRRASAACSCARSRRGCWRRCAATGSDSGVEPDASTENVAAGRRRPSGSAGACVMVGACGRRAVIAARRRSSSPCRGRGNRARRRGRPRDRPGGRDAGREGRRDERRCRRLSSS